VSTTTRCARAPHITAWSAEQSDPDQLIQRPDDGTAYADETAEDRDEHGVSWQRAPSGTPEFKAVHGTRQRQVMRELLCQVCASPADQDDDGTLWGLKDHRSDWRDRRWTRFRAVRPGSR
jgi:hypothetical protein